MLLGPADVPAAGQEQGAKLKPLALLDRLLPVYEEVLRRLAHAGADWVQVDEPVLALDLAARRRCAAWSRPVRLGAASDQIRVCLATYFGDLRDNLPAALKLPVAAVHLDLVRAPEQLDRALDLTPQGMMLSLGVVDGRNVWRADLDRGAWDCWKGGGPARPRPAHRRPLLLAVALPDRPRQRARRSTPN